jgi:hypothetical protein
MSNLSRRSFLKTAGVATGAAMIGVAPAMAEPIPEIVTLPSPLPTEPLVAYVRDAAKGEVTVVSGLNKLTFKDPLLVKRIQKAAHRQHVKKAGEVA